MSDWQSITLQEILSVIESGSRPKGGVRIGENSKGVPSYGGENISMNGGMLYDSVRMVPADFAAGMSRGLLEDKDVLINKDGANTGKSGIYRRPTGEHLATINEHLFRLRCKHEIADQEFLFHFLNSQLGKDQIGRVITGSAQPGLNSTFPEFVKIDLPPLPEQKKIAEILSGIDRLICIENNRLSALNRLLQSHLSSSRFSEGDPVAMSDACLLVADCMHKTPLFEDTGYPIVRTPNVRDGNLVFEGMKFISENSYQEWVRKDKPEAGDILFTREAPLGEACIVPNGPLLCIGQRMMLLRADKRVLSPEFLLFRLRSSVIQQKLQLMSGGSTVGHANVKEIRSLEIEVPSHAEQSVAVKIYQSISSSISAHSEMKGKLLNLKSAISNDLLSGRKRVSEAQVLEGVGI